MGFWAAPVCSLLKSMLVNSKTRVNSLGINAFASGGLTLSSATVTNAPSRRHTPVRQFTDNLTYIKGNHWLNFGGNFTSTYWNQSITAVPAMAFATSATLDPAGTNAFSSLAATQQAGASQLYYVLAGRLSAVNANVRLNEDTLKYSYFG